jgi:phytoene desaturase
VRYDDPAGEPAAVSADAVVLTPDLPVAYRLLGRAPRRLVPLRWAPSAVVLHAGGPAQAANPRGRADGGLAHHTVSFGTAWSRTFQEILRRGQLMSDPSLLLTRPTATDPSLAPPGHHLSYLLAPCPNTARAQLDWARVGPAYAQELTRVLASRGMPELTGPMEVSRLVTPADWAAGGLAAGTPFSVAHTVAQTGPFRPRNLPAGWSNVVLAGCGTTPGVGVPPVLISGRLAAARITGLATARRQ